MASSDKPTEGRLPYSLPWTSDEIEALRQHQTQGRFHPYTCNGGRAIADHAHDHEVKLVPTAEGWKCPECDTNEGTWVL